MNSAIKLKVISVSDKRIQTLYLMDPPHGGYKFVLASAINSCDAHETYLFGACASGEVVDFNELRGSSKGHTDADRAIRDAGYSVVEVAGE